MPLGYVVSAYLEQKSTEIEFSAKERVGVAYIRPAAELLGAVVEARSAAVEAAAGRDRGAGAATQQLASAVRAVDAAGGTASQLALAREWAPSSDR